MNGWTPWEVGDAVEDWVKVEYSVLITLDKDNINDKIELVAEAAWVERSGRWYYMNGDPVVRPVTAYRRKPAPYKPCEDIVIGQIRRSDLDVDVKVIEYCPVQPKTGPRNWVCEIRIGKRVSFRKIVQDDILKTWPTVLVLDEGIENEDNN